MTAEMITIREYCLHHHTTPTFIEALEQSGLISITLTEEERCIAYDQLPELECYTRWYYDLDINVEGIEVVQQLLHKLKEQQQRIHALEEKLRLHEG